VAEVDTVEVTAAARNVADTEAVVVDAIANTDRTAVARATVVAVSPDTVAVASLDTVVVGVVAAALTVVAMAHKLPEATEAARNRRLHQLRQSQLSLPLLRPCSHLSNSR
jgi:hypothetical protein